MMSVIMPAGRGADVLFQDQNENRSFQDSKKPENFKLLSLSFDHKNIVGVFYGYLMINL